MKHDFADGKYTVSYDNGKLSALRNGEPWNRDLVGDKLIYSMLAEVDRLKEVQAELAGAFRDLIDFAQKRGWQINYPFELKTACKALDKATGETT